MDLCGKQTYLWDYYFYEIPRLLKNGPTKKILYISFLKYWNFKYKNRYL